MKDAANRAAILVGALLVLPSGGPSAADDDHDRALRALRAGQAMPLAEILESVQSQLDGDVIGVDFDLEGDRWVYEIKVISKTGGLSEVHVDALTAEVLKNEGE